MTWTTVDGQGARADDETQAVRSPDENLSDQNHGSEQGDDRRQVDELQPGARTDRDQHGPLVPGWDRDEKQRCHGYATRAILRVISSLPGGQGMDLDQARAVPRHHTPVRTRQPHVMAYEPAHRPARLERRSGPRQAAWLFSTAAASEGLAGIRPTEQTPGAAEAVAPVMGRGGPVRLHVEEDVDAAPSDVFRFVATEHFANHPKWDPSVVEMTPTSPGPMHRGATARLVRDDGGRRTEGFVTVTDYQPDSHFAAVVEMAPFRLEQQVLCSPGTAGGTHLSLTIDTRAKTPLNLLLPLMRPRFEKTMRASVRSIKRHVEGRRPH